MLRAYGLTEPDLTDAVRLLRSTFHGYCALESTGGFGASRDVQKSWDKAIDALHILLEHWPREEQPRASLEAAKTSSTLDHDSAT
jgi:hypothetical protein